eukprot:1157965-Pelagomonas_calceolata.AAC.3
MLMKSVPAGAVSRAWMGATDQLLWLPNIKGVLQFCPLHRKPPKLRTPDERFCWFCMPRIGADGSLTVSGQELPANLVANFSAAPATASHAPLTLQGCLALFFGWVEKIPRWGVPWAGQGSLV